MGIVEQIESLKGEPVASVIAGRLREFEEAGRKKRSEVFGELCFCLMTANFSAEKCVDIQAKMGRGFEVMSQEELALELKKAGHRFWPQRAEYIVGARGCELELDSAVGNGKERREKLVKDIKGLGMKEASHFLRNIGFKDVAIIDFHIIDLLRREGLICFNRDSETLTKKKYLEIEGVLEDLGKKVGLNLAELDLYLWYIETGKVLK